MPWSLCGALRCTGLMHHGTSESLIVVPVDLIRRGRYQPPRAFSQAEPECRVSAHDTCRVLLPPTGLAQWRQPCCAPVRPAPDRSSATSSARGRPRAAHRPYANGLTAFRMRSACCLRSFGTIAPSPLRQHARAYTYRGLPAFAFALHGRQRRYEPLASYSTESIVWAATLALRHYRSEHVSPGH